MLVRYGFELRIQPYIVGLGAHGSPGAPESFHRHIVDIGRNDSDVLFKTGSRFQAKPLAPQTKDGRHGNHERKNNLQYETKTRFRQWQRESAHQLADSMQR